MWRSLFFSKLAESKPVIILIFSIKLILIKIIKYSKKIHLYTFISKFIAWSEISKAIFKHYAENGEEACTILKRSMQNVSDKTTFWVRFNLILTV